MGVLDLCADSSAHNHCAFALGDWKIKAYPAIILYAGNHIRIAKNEVHGDEKQKMRKILIVIDMQHDFIDTK